MKHKHYDGGIAPYGYRLTKKGLLVKEPKEAMAIKLAKKLRKEGRTLLDIGVILAEKGYLSRTSKTISAIQIKRMVEEKK